jgi:hypothetical protein
LNKQIWGCRDRIYAQNFDAVLVVIVILAGEATFATGGVENTYNYTILTSFRIGMFQNSGSALFVEQKSACGRMPDFGKLEIYRKINNPSQKRQHVQ